MIGISAAPNYNCYNPLTKSKHAYYNQQVDDLNVSLVFVIESNGVSM